MDEISRCCRIIGVEPGASLEEVKKAYRDLVQVWHPDRFSENERLRLKAQEQLKEINLAYDYLIANAFENNALAAQNEVQNPPSSPSPADAPAENEAPPDTEPEEPEPKQRMSGILVSTIVIVLISGGFFYYWKTQHRSVPTETKNQETLTNSTATPPPVLVMDRTPPASSPPIPTGDLLSAMVTANDLEVAPGPDGLVLNSAGGDRYLHTPQPVRAPFILKTKIKTNLKDVRLYYGFGRVIFNWADNPSELRVHDPVTGRVTAVGHQGMLTPNDWHDLTWEIATNSMKVSVDGELRFEAKGDYRRINAFPGIGPSGGQVVVKSFEIAGQKPGEETKPTAQHPRPVFAGDLLSSMVPKNKVKVAWEPEGAVLSATDESGPCICSTQSFHPPFIIRTAVKTDSTNIRLYAGPSGCVIFDWEVNPSELRVQDPLTGQITPVPGRGMIWPNEWHEITWDILDTGMSVAVDGLKRFQNQKDYHTLQATPGIGPAWSTVTVEYFVVEQK